MKNKVEYVCILYDVGDKVIEKYGNTQEILEIESTDLKYVGIFPCLFLKFKDKPFSPNHFSNLFIPAEETVEKYKDGLKYFIETKVTSPNSKITTNKRSKTKDTFTFRPKREKKEDIDLTDENVFRTKIIKRSSFQPPITKNNGDNNNN